MLYIIIVKLIFVRKWFHKTIINIENQWPWGEPNINHAYYETYVGYSKYSKCYVAGLEINLGLDRIYTGRHQITCGQPAKLGSHNVMVHKCLGLCGKSW